MNLCNKTSSVLLAAGLLVGCSGPTTLYQWDNFQPVLYQYYQQDEIGPEEQVAALEENIEQARARGTRVPPGLHAHLGLLYANTGREEEALNQFATEKALFPESAPFMDFLLKQGKERSQ
ncbi:DUF4810 domain-containing protein [Zobellella maritima]|uniref:DUF4810 domain-containing protein n=1 Tax=Zobellella maritima TaxID=2059725 RepID=UPI000E2FF960|nr:DUF4810 domain-containing protein [Zobellella maritima]